MIKKELSIGMLIGLIANAIGLLVTATIFGNGDGFMKVIKAAIAEDFIGKLISLGAILNLIAFFVFIKKKQDYRAKGVLLITIFIAVFTFIVKL
ncbi:hypothetical protein D7030_00255 [Flavobacteriaceae bacterium AU392]|nr:hypothetical protein D1817_14180 [Flavobacteriaceae bacterium]RKM86965.1 hypothetical protein D7030_00255 [Flavobacteriaceae bacterium AU392]